MFIVNNKVIISGTAGFIGFHLANKLLHSGYQVIGVDSSGNYIKDQAMEWDDYKLHMLKIQKLMIDQFGVEARANDQLANMLDLANKLGSTDSAEND